MLCLSPQSLMTQHLSKLGRARKNKGGRVECATTVIQITKESRLRSGSGALQHSIQVTKWNDVYF